MPSPRTIMLTNNDNRTIATTHEVENVGGLLDIWLYVVAWFSGSALVSIKLFVGPS